MQRRITAPDRTGHTYAEPAGRLLVEELIDGGFVDRWARMFATRHHSPARLEEITDRIVGIAATPLPLALYLADRDAQVTYLFDASRAAVEALIGSPMVTTASKLGAALRQHRDLHGQDAQVA